LVLVKITKNTKTLDTTVENLRKPQIKLENINTIGRNAGQKKKSVERSGRSTDLITA